MRNNFFKAHVTLAVFLVGAMVGILGGLLIDFCLVSFYRWLDFYNSETRIHPNTIPLSIDFWIFIFCITILIGLLYFFCCILVKYVERITNQRERNVIPSTHLREITTTDSERSPEEPSDRESYRLIFECFKENSTLFTILAAVATTVTLIQVFAIFVLGENWLTIILSGFLAFPILILILVSLFGVIWLSGYILCLIAIHFFYNVIKNGNIRRSVRIEATVFISVGLLGIGCIFFYLIFTWFAKLEFLTLFLGFYLFLLIFVVPVSFLLINVLWDLHRQSQACIQKALAVIGILFLIIVLLLLSITVAQGMSILNDQISKYHSDKTVIVEINGSIVDLDTKIPVILRLNKTNDAGLTQNFSFLDGTYAQCHWSTNYGYFFTITSNNSQIKRQLQELIIPGCDDQTDTYWTYDIGDYGKNKPPVIIGLTVEDSIKPGKKSLGDARIMLNWTTMDTVNISYNVTNIGSPF